LIIGRDSKMFGQRTVRQQTIGQTPLQ